MLGEREGTESRVCLAIFSPPPLPPAAREKCALWCAWKRQDSTPFFINSFIYPSPFNNLETEVFSRCSQGRQTRDPRCYNCLLLRLPPSPPSPLLSRCHPGRQVLGFTVSVLHCGLWWDWRCIILWARYCRRPLAAVRRTNGCRLTQVTRREDKPAGISRERSWLYLTLNTRNRLTSSKNWCKNRDSNNHRHHHHYHHHTRCSDWIKKRGGGGGGASAANQLENHTRALVLMPERSFRGEASHLICCLTKAGLLDELWKWIGLLINGICFHFKEPLRQSDMLFGRQGPCWSKRCDSDSVWLRPCVRI